MVAPASFNTVNKIAGGISDTLAVGIACEYIGLGKPVVVAPWPNRALPARRVPAVDRAPAAGRRQLVLIERTTPGADLVEIDETEFLWDDVLTEVRKARPGVSD